MWQWAHVLPRALGSKLLEGCPQPTERRAQIFVLDVGKISRDTGRRLAIDGALRRRRAPAKRGLPEPQAANRLPAEEAIDPLEDDW